MSKTLVFLWFKNNALNTALQTFIKETLKENILEINDINFFKYLTHDDIIW